MDSLWEIPGSDTPFETDIYTATGVGTQHGKTCGCITSFLEMIKVNRFTFNEIFINANQEVTCATLIQNPKRPQL